MSSVPERPSKDGHTVERELRLPLSGGGEKSSRAICTCGWCTEWLQDADATRVAQADAAAAHGIDVGADVFADSDRRLTAVITSVLRWGAKRYAAEKRAEDER